MPTISIFTNETGNNNDLDSRKYKGTWTNKKDKVINKICNNN